ncbi:hypothetical protein IWQ56_001094 [Coemansia nantahalensis]|nr:hypothetical protein IWQ56_001094 [Coemansia nantahalensis]
MSSHVPLPKERHSTSKLLIMVSSLGSKRREHARALETHPFNHRLTVVAPAGGVDVQRALEKHMGSYFRVQLKLTDLIDPAFIASYIKDKELVATAAASSQSGVIRAAIDALLWLGRPATASQLEADSKARICRRANASGRSELDDCPAAPLAGPSASAMRWWRARRAAFPDLARLPGEYLSIPPSCCAEPSLFRRGAGPDYAQVAALDRRSADAYIYSQ